MDPSSNFKGLLIKSSLFFIVVFSGGRNLMGIIPLQKQFNFIVETLISELCLSALMRPHLETCWSGSRGGHKNDQGYGTPLL